MEIALRTKWKRAMIDDGTGKSSSAMSHLRPKARRPGIWRIETFNQNKFEQF